MSYCSGLRDGHRAAHNPRQATPNRSFLPAVNHVIATQNIHIYMSCIHTASYSHTHTYNNVYRTCITTRSYTRIAHVSHTRVSCVVGQPGPLALFADPVQAKQHTAKHHNTQPPQITLRLVKCFGVPKRSRLAICPFTKTRTNSHVSWVAILVSRYLYNTAPCGFYCITCLTQLIEFAALLTTFEEHRCQTSGIRRVAPPEPLEKSTGSTWIPFGDHPLTLERYREYQHVPCARMTRTTREEHRVDSEEKRRRGRAERCLPAPAS